MAQRWQNVIFNICIALNSLLLFLLLFAGQIQLPGLIQVIGRMHPLVLHFPIVLLIISFIWELTFPKNKMPLLSTIGNWLLLMAAFTSVLAALMGLFLSKEEGYDAEGLALHKYSGVAIAVICTCWYSFKKAIRKNKISTITAGTIIVLGLIFTAHQGASITHGENFLMAPITPSQKKVDVLLDDAIAYTHLIAPILEAKCMPCHNEKKAKGDLMMQTTALLLKGGKNGALWDTADVNKGLLIHRINLNESNKEHMPPTGKPQLTEQEKQALYYWIKGGASFTQKIIDLPEGDTLRTLASSFFNTLENDNYDFAAVSDATLEKLNTGYRVVKPLAINSPAVSVEFFGTTFFNANQIKELAEIKNNIVSLNLSKMPLIDDDIKEIATFKNLRKLNLSFTNITGATLSALSPLKELRQLSLAGNKINSSAIEPLSRMEKLATVYIWQTGLSDEVVNKLKSKFRNTNLQTGFKSDTVIAKLNAPIIAGDQQIFSNTTSVKVKNFIKGAVMRYTLTGDDPDSLTSSVYKDSIVIDKPGTLKIKAFLPGWISSTVSSKMFYKTGFKPDSIFLATPPTANYIASGGKTLADGEKGDFNFRTKWLGYKDNRMEALLYFNAPAKLSNISISTIIDIGSYIMPAQQIEVWVGKNKGTLKRIKTLKPKQPTMQDPPYLTGFDINFPAQEISVIKIIATPVQSLPSWHPGKGQKGWFFVDEIFLN